MGVHIIKGALRRRAAPIGYRAVINGHRRERSDYVARQKTETAVQQVIWMEAEQRGIERYKSHSVCSLRGRAWVLSFGFWIYVDIRRPGNEGRAHRKAQICFSIDEEDRLHVEAQPSNSKVFGSIRSRGTRAGRVASCGTCSAPPTVEHIHRFGSAERNSSYDALRIINEGQDAIAIDRN